MFRKIKQFRIFLLVHIIWRKYKIGKKLHVGARVKFIARERLEIGDYVFIGRGSEIQTDSIIGDFVIMGNNVGIVGKYDHQYQEIGKPIRLAKEVGDPGYNGKGSGLITVIEEDVWVGYGCIILGGIKIAKGSIVAAGSLVTKDLLEPYSIYAGHPAKKIGQRFETEEDLYEHKDKYERFKQALKN